MRVALLSIGTMVWASICSAQPRRTPQPQLPQQVPQQPGIRLAPELARVLTDYEAAWRAGDGTALARLFDEDGFVLPNGAPPVRGRAAIGQYYKGPGGPLAVRAFARKRPRRLRVSPKHWARLCSTSAGAASTMSSSWTTRRPFATCGRISAFSPRSRPAV